jgi:fucose 4-O-acetylase-like acetyltransferase
MPIFFFISGMVFDPTKYGRFRTFVVKKFKSLMIPYAFFYLISFFYWIFIERKYRGGDISPISQLIGLFYGSDNTYMFFNGALWFLPCLFTTGVIYFIVNKINVLWGKIVSLIVLYLIGLFLVKTSITGFPWGGNIALFACLFYGMGHLLKNKIEQAKKYLSVYHYCIIITVCGILQIFTLNYTHLDFADLIISDFSVPIAILGITLYLSLSLALKKNKLLEFLGVNSLVLFAFQEPVYRAVISICVKITEQDVVSIRTNLFLCILITIITIVLIIPLIFIYNRFVAPQIKKI